MRLGISEGNVCVLSENIDAWENVFGMVSMMRVTKLHHGATYDRIMGLWMQNMQ
ncbi:MAG: hypothetical protein LBJ20_01640 [Candidatus Methanoplasma sp.]|jgi:hypothetical protein|nr:hypothetical protein [Candidatus Methanoplasma sp.]